MKNNKKNVAVLGGGISGLTTGYALKKRGFNVTVYEQSKNLGGVIKTRKEEGWMVETGPNSIMVKDKILWDFFDELQITDRIVKANKQAKKRFIVRDEKLHAVPASLLNFLSTPLFSAGTKLQLFKEPFAASSKRKDESIASFMSRRLGGEVLDYAVNPFVAGVYAGDPKALSIKHTFSSLYEMEQKHGSIFKGIFKKERNRTKKALLSFDEGLQVLINQLQNKLGSSVKLSHTVKQIQKTENEWTVQIQTAGKITAYKHSTVISTIPSRQLSKAWGQTTSKKSIQKLETIKYAPISVLALGFKREQIDHPLDGFGFLVPEKENLNLLGCLFSSSLFPNRAPVNHVLLTCFIGGERNPEMAGKSTQKLIAKALDDLNQLLGIKGKPSFNNHIYWPRAIPQFNVGYDQYLRAAAKIEKENPAFFIGGNFISGVSVPDCIQSSLKLVDKIS